MAAGRLGGAKLDFLSGPEAFHRWQTFKWMPSAGRHVWPNLLEVKDAVPSRGASAFMFAGMVMFA